MQINLDLRAPIQDDLLEPALVEVNAQAAEVCFDRHHISPVLVTLVQNRIVCDECFEIKWKLIDTRQLRSNANRLNAAEVGAYAVAIALIRHTHNLCASGRADHLTGADYYAIPSGSDDFENAIRLEVSGTESDEMAVLNQRLRNKVDQLKRGASNLPGIACVIGFQLAAIKLQVVNHA